MSITTFMSGRDRDETDGLPPAAMRVLKALREAGDPLTTGELVDETLHRQRTVREAAGRLQEAELVEMRWASNDARQRVYRLADDTTEDNR